MTKPIALLFVHAHGVIIDCKRGMVNNYPLSKDISL